MRFHDNLGTKQKKINKKGGKEKEAQEISER
jgi:hypothetical protein